VDGFLFLLNKILDVFKQRQWQIPVILWIIKPVCESRGDGSWLDVVYSFFMDLQSGSTSCECVDQLS
jgi:hypothetical protein